MAEQARLRRRVRLVVAAAVVLCLFAAGPLWLKSQDWKDAVYRFPTTEGEYRVRLTGGFGTSCARLEHEAPIARTATAPSCATRA